MAGGWGIVELGHFDKHFVKNNRKRGPTSKKKLEIYLLDPLKTTF